MLKARRAAGVSRGRLLVACLTAAPLIVSACSRTPSRVGPALPLARPAWLAALPATHDALSTVLAALSRYGVREKWSGAREQAFAEYLSAIAHAGPTATPGLFPTRDDAAAYAIDAHVAWVVALGRTPGLRSRDVWALRNVRFPLDGRTSTLAELEAEVAARLPFEPRAALLLNPGWRGAPPLPAAAIEARSLQFQIALQAGECGRIPGFWGLDPVRRVVRVSSYTRFMWGLPAEGTERARRLLRLVPPPADLQAAIIATCGESLMRCSVASGPFDPSRLIEPTVRP